MDQKVYQKCYQFEPLPWQDNSLYQLEVEVASVHSQGIGFVSGVFEDDVDYGVHEDTADLVDSSMNSKWDQITVKVVFKVPEN